MLKQANVHLQTSQKGGFVEKKIILVLSILATIGHIFAATLKQKQPNPHNQVAMQEMFARWEHSRNSHINPSQDMQLYRSLAHSSLNDLREKARAIARRHYDDNDSTADLQTLSSIVAKQIIWKSGCFSRASRDSAYQLTQILILFYVALYLLESATDDTTLANKLRLTTCTLDVAYERIQQTKIIDPTREHDDEIILYDVPFTSYALSFYKKSLAKGTKASHENRRWVFCSKMRNHFSSMIIGFINCVLLMPF